MSLRGSTNTGLNQKIDSEFETSGNTVTIKYPTSKDIFGIVNYKNSYIEFEGTNQRISDLLDEIDISQFEIVKLR